MGDGARGSGRHAKRSRFTCGGMSEVSSCCYLLPFPFHSPYFPPPMLSVPWSSAAVPSLTPAGVPSWPSRCVCWESPSPFVVIFVVVSWSFTCVSSRRVWKKNRRSVAGAAICNDVVSHLVLTGSFTWAACLVSLSHSLSPQHPPFLWERVKATA